MGLIELISERMSAELRGVPYLCSIPCKVLEVIDETYSRVENVANGAKYTLPNYSASNIKAGDNCIVYYTNGTPIGVTGYIAIAVLAPSESVPVNRIESDVSSVIATTSHKTFSIIGVKTNGIVVATLFINLNVYGSADGEFQMRISVAGESELFEPKQTIALGQYTSISYTIPLTLQNGASKIIASCVGAGSIVGGKMFLTGHGIEQYEEFEPTTEEDYLYISSTDSIYTRSYIGNKTNIAMPEELNNLPIKTIGGATFNYSDVTGVYIPDGIEEIE